MLQATDGLPLNIGLTGKGNTSRSDGLVDQIRAGAIGLKLHEDWGTTPAAIDQCLAIAEEEEVQVTIHTDTVNESGYVDDTIAAPRIRGETIAAEYVPHDLGAISILSSDAQAMGRVGEVVTRTWQTAHKMKLQRGRMKTERGDNDNQRIRRYVAKYTINPAI